MLNLLYFLKQILFHFEIFRINDKITQFLHILLFSVENSCLYKNGGLVLSAIFNGNSIAKNIGKQDVILTICAFL